MDFQETHREKIEAEGGYYQITERFTDLQALNERQRRVGTRARGAPMLTKEIFSNTPGIPGEEIIKNAIYEIQFRVTVYTLTYWTTDEEQAAIKREQESKG